MSNSYSFNQVDAPQTVWQIFKSGLDVATSNFNRNDSLSLSISIIFQKIISFFFPQPKNILQDKSKKWEMFRFLPFKL